MSDVCSRSSYQTVTLCAMYACMLSKKALLLMPALNTTKKEKQDVIKTQHVDLVPANMFLHLQGKHICTGVDCMRCSHHTIV